MAGDAADPAQHRGEHDTAGIIDAVRLGRTKQIGALVKGFAAAGVAVAGFVGGVQLFGKQRVERHQAAAAGMTRPDQHLLAAGLRGEDVAEARRHRQPVLRVNRVQPITKIRICRHPIPLPRGAVAASFVPILLGR